MNPPPDQHGKPIAPGALVRVGLAYQGNGHCAPDGLEGVWTCVGVMSTGSDYYLVRGETGPLPKSEWECIFHVSRLELLRLAPRPVLASEPLDTPRPPATDNRPRGPLGPVGRNPNNPYDE